VTFQTFQIYYISCCFQQCRLTSQDICPFLFLLKGICQPEVFLQIGAKPRLSKKALFAQLWNLLLLFSRQGEGSKTERGKVVNTKKEEGD